MRQSVYPGSFQKSALQGAALQGVPDPGGLPVDFLIELFSSNLPNCSRSYAVSQMNRIKMKFSTCLNTLSNSSNFKNMIISKNCKTTATREEYFEGKCFQELQKMQMMCCCKVCCLALFLYRLWHHALLY